MRLLGTILVCVVLVGCKSFEKEKILTAETPREGERVVGIGNLDRKLTIDARGVFVDGVFRASRMEVQAESRTVVMKSFVTSAFVNGVGAVAGTPLMVEEASEFLNSEGVPINPDQVLPGAFVKVRCRRAESGLFVRKLEVRDRKPGEVEELEGTIEVLDAERGRMVVGSLPVVFDQGLLVTWDPDAGESPEFKSVKFERKRDLRRIRVVDDENWRPDPAIVIEDWLSVSGEVQYEGEYRNNHNLRDNRDRDRLIHDFSTKLEFTLTPNEDILAFASLRFGQGIVHFDQGADEDERASFAVEELFGFVENFPLPGLSLQIGRQDFDHGREWLMDDQIDGVRAWVNLDAVVAELSVSRVLFDPDIEEADITNYLVGLHAAPLPDSNLFLYGLHRRGGDLVDLDRTHVGASFEVEVSDFEFWLDLGHSFGEEDGVSTRGYGVDAMVMWADRDSIVEPSIYVGFAFGSGERNDPGERRHGFRQSGLHDNAMRLNGVTSFRYMGELVRPELSNLMVLTAGVGFRLFERTSIDFVWHHYRQVIAQPFLVDTRLRL
ncbi:MAG TPA: alginate export family protein, partial [Planctomycetota bacterium]|nr:alginate export family protein [Planctomycetota bacterium]